MAHPEAEIQKAIVKYLRMVLGPDAIVHCSANEVRRGGSKGMRQQMVNRAMGVKKGFPDLMVIAGGEVWFLEVKSARGRLSDAQIDTHDILRRQGFRVYVVRSIDDVQAILKDQAPAE